MCDCIKQNLCHRWFFKGITLQVPKQVWWQYVKQLKSNSQFRNLKILKAIRICR